MSLRRSASGLSRLGFGRGVALIGAFDLGFGAFGEDCGAGAVGGLAALSGAGEVLVAVPGFVAGRSIMGLAPQAQYRVPLR